MLTLCAVTPAAAATLKVGPGQAFKSLSAANKAAKAGDTILVWPRQGNAAYERVAVFVTKPNLTFKAHRKPSQPRIPLSGKGFDYSGKGSVPRAIFQFQKNAKHGQVEGFELTGASNASHNGAGVRINQANFVSIRDCDIHHNDMGVQSNGDGGLKSAMGQLIERCHVHHNGNHKDPGYNHNFYLGGSSAVVRFCHIHHSLTGHNIKSRAHSNWIAFNFIHDSKNRELDLVDGKETGLPDSHSVVLGNVIVKDPKCQGNKGVIHFGQDGGKDHKGALFLVNNTILSPHLTAIVQLSAPSAQAKLFNNIVDAGAGPQPRPQTLLSASKKARLSSSQVSHNWLRESFKTSKPKYQLGPNNFGRLPVPFVNASKHDYRLAKAWKSLVNVGLRVKTIKLPSSPLKDGAKSPLAFCYRHPLSSKKRKIKGRPDLGAYEYGQ